MMKLQTRVLIIFGMVMCIVSEAYATQGRAVWYKPPYSPSACKGRSSNGPWVAGVSDALWAGGRACGRRLRVRCIRGTNKAPHPCRRNRSVVVEVVDYCRPPCAGVINLSRDAFAAIASLDAGNVIVDYSRA